MADTLKCYVCGKEYRYCPRCAEFAHSPSWMHMYDSEECFIIDNVLNAYWNNHITKDEAVEKLKGLNLNKVTNEDLLVAVKKFKDDDKRTFRKKTTDSE